jgi:hypothetical protein
MGDRDSLCEDYVLLVLPARGINLEGSEEKMKQIWEVISHYEDGLTNYGNLSDGNSHRTGLDTFKQSKSRISHAVFKDRDSLKACLKEIKEADFGISMVVSGIEEDVHKVCDEIGLTPHTANYSLGFQGKTEKLPPQPVLEITTMCGHALVSKNLVEKMVEDIRSGERIAKEAAVELSRPCECGIFSPYRAEKLLERIAGA